MVDQLVGLILLGLGIKNPINGQVMGDKTEIRQEVTKNADEEVSDSSKFKKKSVKSEIRSVKDPAKELREALKDTKKTDIDELKNTRLQLKSDFHASNEASRIEFEEKKKELQEEIKVKRDEFKQKVSELKDERKKEIVTHVDDRMKEVNAKRVARMSAHLAKMTEILGKVSERAAKANTNGKDTSSVDAAIDVAKLAIGTAQDAVDEQGLKEYVATINSVSTLKNDVGAAMKSLEMDLKNVQELVMNARKSVTDAITELGTVVRKTKQATQSQEVQNETETTVR